MLMKKTALAASLALAGILAASQGFAADSPYTIVRTQDLIGKQVKNRAGTVLGKVEDYVINVKDGSIVYGVLQHGDTLGFGGKLFAVAPQAISLADDQKAVILDVEKDDLEKATGFDANRWPTEPDTRWGKKPPPTKDDVKKDEPRKDEVKKEDAKKDDAKKDEEKAAHLRRVTSLMGAAVKSNNGEDLGSIQGIVFDLKKNHVLYAGMSYGGVAGIGSKYFAVPWEALTLESPTLKAGDRAFVMNFTKTELDSATGFDNKAWPTEPDKMFSKGGKKEPPKP
jgi:sporulation protein YlmC with PRC-barrel domain